MRKKRLGTISMAVVLIGFGILLFLAQINEVSAVKLAMKFWPGILLLLGGEILWFSYRNKDDDVKASYDIFSIFIVLIILITNIGLYGLMETGLLDLVKSKVTETHFQYELEEDFVVDSSVDKIIINGARSSTLNVRTVEGDKIVATGFIDTVSGSEENAEKILDEDLINISKVGNTVYVKYKDGRKYDTHFRDLSLMIPANKDVEIVGGYNLNIVMDNMNNNWIIDEFSQVKARVNKDSNLKILAEVRGEEDLKGNVKWKDTNVGTPENHIHRGELTYGEGQYSLNILNASEVIIDEI